MRAAAAVGVGAALLAAFAPSVPASRQAAVGAAPVTVLLVRHAEKAAQGGSDPALSEAGRARAAELARTCAAARPSTLFCSTFARTRQTLEPLAQASGLQPQARDPKQVDALAAELRALAPGSTAVVAGHSNTVPALAKALGAELHGLTNGTLAETDYDRLFVLSIDPAGTRATGCVELRYGAPSVAPPAAPGAAPAAK